MKVQVKVFPRKGVRDPQGEAILDKLRRLDWLDVPVNSVTVGKVFLLDVEDDDADDVFDVAARMCEEFLSNEIIEDYTVTVLED